jgi:hypothetical protein
LSKTAKLGACGLPLLPIRKLTFGKSLATLRAAASTAKLSPTMSWLPPHGVLAHDALVVGVGDVLAGLVLDVAARLAALSALWMRLTHCCSNGTV